MDVDQTEGTEFGFGGGVGRVWSRRGRWRRRGYCINFVFGLGHGGLLTAGAEEQNQCDKKQGGRPEGSHGEAIRFRSRTV